MALSGLTLVRAPLGSITTKERDKRPLVEVVTLRPQKLRAQETLKVSRRESFFYLTAETLWLNSILATEPAEARTGRLEMKRKIIEKLREKIEKSKQEADDSKQTRMSEQQVKEKELALLAPPITFPNPQEGTIGPPS